MLVRLCLEMYIDMSLPGNGCSLMFTNISFRQAGLSKSVCPNSPPSLD